MMCRLIKRNKSKQSGTALISVLLIFAVCSVLAVEMQERQHIDIRRTINILSRDQAYLYASAAEAIAFDALLEDLKRDNRKGDEIDHLDEEWHGEKSLPVDGGAVTASITELQGKLNLNALRSSNPVVVAEAKLLFKGLMDELGLPKAEENAFPTDDMLNLVMEWMDQNDEDDALVEGEDYYYQGLEVAYRTSNNYMTNISELRLVRGFSDEDIAELEEYIVFLPPDTPLNINTVDTTLAGLLRADGATAIVTDRPKKGWDDPSQIPAAAVIAGSPAPKQLVFPAVAYSEYFLLTATVTINQRTITNKSVIYRPRQPDKDNPMRVIMRDRGKKFHYIKTKAN